MFNDDLQWFEKMREGENCQRLRERPIAYFCAEYALSDQLPIYAGGLGILAGDYIREAAEREVPLVGIGLYYPEGFAHKELSKQGKVVETHQKKSPEELGMLPARNSEGQEVIVQVPIQDRMVKVRAWVYPQKNVNVYLLDTRVEGNSESDQHITDNLYITDKEVRLKQEMILGIGGLRLLRALKIHPGMYHLNEGHSAFLVYELIRHEMDEHKMDFEEAKRLIQERILFTNHTLVAAGNDVFSNDLVALLLTDYSKEIAIPVKKLVDMGLVQESSAFSLTILALRAAGKTNAVSKLHAEKAKEIWTDHPMFPITNGIHIPTWDKVRGEDNIWERHLEQKRKLLERVREETGQSWEENALVLGWARRIVKYKRPLALVERLKQFGEIARSEQRPVKVIFAGVSHPDDEDGRELLEELQYRLNSDLKGVAVYLPHYNMELSGLITSGCDVWVNTPVVGFEACGTSGMKAALNGVIPLTTLDGWAAEVDLYQIGWSLNDADVGGDIQDKLREEIVPMYFDNRQEWKNMMKNARSLVYNQFSMTRALREYLEKGMGIC